MGPASINLTLELLATHLLFASLGTLAGLVPDPRDGLALLGFALAYKSILVLASSGCGSGRATQGASSCFAKHWRQFQQNGQDRVDSHYWLLVRRQ